MTAYIGKIKKIFKLKLQRELKKKCAVYEEGSVNEQKHYKQFVKIPQFFTMDQLKLIMIKSKYYLKIK